MSTHDERAKEIANRNFEVGCRRDAERAILALVRSAHAAGRKEGVEEMHEICVRLMDARRRGAWSRIRPSGTDRRGCTWARCAMQEIARQARALLEKSDG